MELAAALEEGGEWRKDSDRLEEALLASEEVAYEALTQLQLKENLLAAHLEREEKLCGEMREILLPPFQRGRCGSLPEALVEGESEQHVAGGAGGGGGDLAGPLPLFKSVKGEFHRLESHVRGLERLHAASERVAACRLSQFDLSDKRSKSLAADLSHALSKAQQGDGERDKLQAALSMAKRELEGSTRRDADAREREEAEKASRAVLEQSARESKQRLDIISRDHQVAYAVKESESLRLRSEASCLRKEVSLLSASLRSMERDLGTAHREHGRYKAEAKIELDLQKESSRLAIDARDKAYLEAEQARQRERGTRAERERETREVSRTQEARRERERLERESLEKAYDRERIATARETRELENRLRQLGTEGDVAVRRLQEVEAGRDAAVTALGEKSSEVTRLREELEEKNQAYTIEREQWRLHPREQVAAVEQELPSLGPGGSHVETVEEAALKLSVRRWEEWAHGVARLATDVVCPITLEVMEDPVVAADGITYERAEIQRWLRYNDRSPATNVRLRSIILYPNVKLRGLLASMAEAASGLPCPPAQ